MNFVYRCPRCSGHDTFRCFRKPKERWLIFLRPYLCSDCSHRFYTPSGLPVVKIAYSIATAVRNHNPFLLVSFRRTVPEALAAPKATNPKAPKPNASATKVHDSREMLGALHSSKLS